MVFEMYKGKRFVKDMKNGYYHAHFGDKVKSLHRVKWEDTYGPIPDGFHVHHKDHNKDNNSIDNLELISREEHLSYHSKLNYENNKEEALERLAKIRPLTVEWHRSEEGRKWHSEHAKKVFNNLDDIELTCENCGKKYITNVGMIGHSKFCSNACKSAFRRKSGVDNEERACEICGKLFTVNKYSKRRFCSRRCANENKRNNRD